MEPREPRDFDQSLPDVVPLAATQGRARSFICPLGKTEV